MSRVVIDANFLRKRAEHNEGCLTTLEEIALHQLNIEKIENFDKLIRHVKILLLQNNLIPKMENLTKLKELNYLNLALNNIEVIEGLEGCESLEKLDMTCNFIQPERFFESLLNLKKCPSIRELHLLGNPLTDWKRYRELTLAMCPNLVTVDSKEITPTERIKALQALQELTAELKVFIQEKKLKDAQMPPEEKAKMYTTESRREMYKEMQAEEQKKEKERRGAHMDKDQKKKEPSSMYNKDGELRICNEGRYPYKLREWDDPEWSFFEIEIPHFMETSQLTCELFPSFVSVRVKDKLTQIKLFEEIIVSESKIQRSQTSGILMATMKKVKEDRLLKAELASVEFNKKKKQEEIEKIKESNISELIERKKLLNTIEEKIKADEELDDLPDLE